MSEFELLPPIHPGEILLEEFLQPMNLSQYRLAKDIDVPPRRINEIVHGKRGVSADTALRLSRYFGLSERFWMNLQSRYDLEIAKDKLRGRLEQEVKVFNVDTERVLADAKAEYNLTDSETRGDFF
jgi:addiction module HigA family antidote